MYMHIVTAMETSPSAPSRMPAAPSRLPAQPAEQRWNPRLWAILFVLCGALFLDALDVSMIGVALPVIRTDLHLNTSSLQWIVSAYVLGYGGLLVLRWPAADPPRRRPGVLGAAGLVLSGVLTEVSWRWTLLLPAPVALLTLVAAIPLIPRGQEGGRQGRRFDVPGGLAVTAGMLLLVYTVVSAQAAGWASARTIGSLPGVGG